MVALSEKLQGRHSQLNVIDLGWVYTSLFAGFTLCCAGKELPSQTVLPSPLQHNVKSASD